MNANREHWKTSFDQAGLSILHMFVAAKVKKDGPNATVNMSAKTIMLLLNAILDYSENPDNVRIDVPASFEEQLVKMATVLLYPKPEVKEKENNE